MRKALVLLASVLVLSCASTKNTDSARPVRAAPPSHTTTGIVLDVQRGTPNAPASYVHLIVQPSGGAPVRVDLGPGWRLDEHGLRFSKDDVVEVEGRTERRGDEDVFVARRLRKDGKTLEIPEAGTSGASSSSP